MEQENSLIPEEEIKNPEILETSTNDELLVMNKSAFYMCPVCGYSEIIKGSNTAPIKSHKHKNYRQFGTDKIRTSFSNRCCSF